MMKSQIKRKRNLQQVNKQQKKVKKKENTTLFTIDHFQKKKEFIVQLKLVGGEEDAFKVQLQTNIGNMYQCTQMSFKKHGVGLPLYKKNEWIKELYCGFDMSSSLLLLTSAGFVYSCGESGQCGVGKEDSFINTLTKVNVGTGNIITLKVTENHVLALSSVGGVYSWGENEFGQCGNGNGNYVFSPIKVNRYFDQPLVQDERIISIQAKYGISVALSNKGAVYHWGRIDGTLIEEDIFIPTLIPELSNLYENNIHPNMNTYSENERIIDVLLDDESKIIAITNKKSVISHFLNDIEFIKNPISYYVFQALENLDDNAELQHIQELIHHGFDVNQKDDDLGCIPLNYACLNVEYSDLFKLLLENHSDVSIKDSEDYLPLQRLLSQPDYIQFDLYDAVQLILQKEPSQIHSMIENQSLLHLLLN